MATSRRHPSDSSDSRSSDDSSTESDDPQTFQPLPLALATLPWFGAAADAVLRSEDILLNAIKVSFYTSFRFEVVVLCLRLDFARANAADQLPKECIGILEEVLVILEGLISWDLLSAAKKKRSRPSNYPRLETLLQYQGAFVQDSKNISESYKFLEVGEEEKNWRRLLSRIERKNKKLEKLLDKLRRTPSIIPATQSTRKPPSSKIRGLGCALHDVLSRRWSCTCSMPHEANVRLATNRKFDNSNERIEFEILLSTNCLPYRWQESSFCVLVPKVEPTKTKIKFMIEDTDEDIPDHPVREIISTICHSIQQAQLDQFCLNVLVDNGDIFQIPPLKKKGLIALSNPNITLASLLQSRRIFSQKETRILGVILAYAMLQMCESPWMNREWDKKSIMFFYESANPSAVDVRRPYISSRFEKATCDQDQQALHRIHPHPGILALGILLLELEFRAPIESYREASGCGGKVNVNTDYTTALWLLEHCADDVYENYKAAIQACLECKFVTKGETFEHERFRKAVYESIVAPLEDELLSGFKISVDDLDDLLNAPAMERGMLRRGSASTSRRSPDFNYFNVMSVPMTSTPRRGPSVSLELLPPFIPPLPEAPSLLPRFNLFDDELGGLSDSSTRSSDKWFMDFENHVLDLLEDPEDSNGRRARVAILDTGFDRNDPAIRANLERIKGWRSWVEGGEADEDLAGHGTHTLALLLKVAPDSDFFVARIAKNNDLENPDHVAEAIHWAANDCDVDIITMSFGFPRRIDSIQEAIQVAHSKNKIMFAAASNNGGNQGIAYPANQLSRIIAINSTDGLGNCSTFNPTPDSQSENFATLGEAVESSWPFQLGLGYTQRKSGTSFATPIAAGIAAVILQYVMQKLPADKYAEASRLHSCEGMKAVLKLMAGERRGYHYIKPWKFLSLEKSQSFICENILEVLREI